MAEESVVTLSGRDGITSGDGDGLEFRDLTRCEGVDAGGGRVDDCVGLGND
jgi:hypothetical protein